MSLGLAAALALLGAACGDSEDVSTNTTQAPAAPSTTAAPMETTTTEAPQLVGILEVSDQTGDGSVLVIDSISLQGGTGHIALHIDVDGNPGQVVGHVSVDEGISTDVEVPFDAPVESGTYWPMVHIDGDGNGEYNFPGPDAPLAVDGTPVMSPVVLTVE
jgi:hypothetical protein